VICPGFVSRWRNPLPGLALALLLPISLAAAQTGETPPPASTAAASGAISPAEYRARLQTLDQLVAACQRETIPANCRGNQVGPDVQVALPAGARPVRFGWLRALLDQAAQKDQEKTQSVTPQQTKPQQTKPAAQPAPDKKQSITIAAEKRVFPAPTLAQRLEDARKRLADDEQLAGQADQADQATAQQDKQPGNSSASQAANAPVNAGAQRRTLTTILAAKEYNPAVVGRSLKDRLLEKVANWIDRALDNIAKVGAKSKWIGPTAEIGFGLLVCVALVWFLIRLERQGRFNAAMLQSGPGSGAASARDWQLWVEDARQAAARGAWRDAIHLLYWASISRLESSGLWPADRARTPREYLALLSKESDQRPNLTALTRSFERTWYAGRAAAEADFRNAEQLAASLGAGSSRASSRMGAR
jgi:Domain of unknown function (DUF4129)